MKCPSCTRTYGLGIADGCDKCLEYTNFVRLLLTPHSGLDKHHEVGHTLDNTAVFAQRYITCVEDAFMCLEKAKALCAGLSLAYNQRKIAARIPDPAALEQRNEEWQAAVKAQKIAQLPKKEKVLLSERDKAINHLVTKLKMSHEVAAKMVDEQMKASGRHPGDGVVN